MSVGTWWRIWGFVGVVWAATVGLRAERLALKHALPLLSGDSQYRITRPWDSLLTGVVVTATAAPEDPERLFVVELTGRILSLSGPQRTNATVFLDISDRIAKGGEHGLCSMVFHPGYATNHQFFIFYSHQPQGSTNVHLRLSRFQTDPEHPDRALPDSEEPLISQLHRDNVHNGGDMHFGPDGYLYISVGDEGYVHGHSNAGRWDYNLFSGILRIDPDQRPDNLLPNPHPSVHPGTYRIPADNPYLNRTNYIIGTDDLHIDIRPEDIRGEFWAVGFRNPWRMSFDPVSGDLYANDVGVASREEVNRVQRGGHHGWFFKEGSLPWPFFVPATGLVDPIHEYEHSLGRVAITGSLFYRGERYPELDGSYLFSDLNGQIHAMQRFDDGSHGAADLIAQMPFTVSLAVDPLDGAILIGGVGLGRLERVSPSTSSLPEKLSDTGLFTSTRNLTPAPGLWSYSVNQPFWSDHAIKSRWFGLPSTSQGVSFDPVEPWDAPRGTVWMKHFDFAIDDTDASRLRRLETRVIVRTTDGVYGATYRWNEAGSDASLVDPEGDEENLVIRTATGTRTQRWRFPSRSECLSCHTPAGGFALSFNTAQWNRTGPDGTNQLQRLLDAGYFEGSPLVRPHLLPAHPDLDDESASVESRVRSYLAVNCSQCHQPNSPSRSPWDARLSTPLADAHIVRQPAVHQIESGGIQIIDPGKPSTSILLRRVAEPGPLHMPPLGTFVINTQAVALLTRWTTLDLPQRPSYEAWRQQYFSNSASDDAPEADPDQDGDSNQHEFLVGTDPLSPSSHWQPVLHAEEHRQVTLTYPRKANRFFQVEMAEEWDGPWEPVNHPLNRPWLDAEDSRVALPLPSGGITRFFRVVITEP